MGRRAIDTRKKIKIGTKNDVFAYFLRICRNYLCCDVFSRQNFYLNKTKGKHTKEKCFQKSYSTNEIAYRRGDITTAMAIN